MAQLIEELFVPAFDNDWLRAGNDSARFSVSSRPHGDRDRQPRRLAAVLSRRRHRLPFGARHDQRRRDVRRQAALPRGDFILEEGFPLADLRRIVASMARHRASAGVPVVTGDTKVVEQGKGDGVFITTTGVGIVPEGVNIAAIEPARATRSSSRGTLGDHGVAIMSQRENLSFETTIESDTAALHELVAAMVDAVPDDPRLRDPTRGGLATTLNEIAQPVGLRHGRATSAISGQARRSAPPASFSVSTRSTSPTKASSSPSSTRAHAERLLAAMRAHPLGRDAALIGEVIDDPHHFVQMETELRRPPHRRLAHRRAAAPDLLRVRCASFFSRIPSTA